MPSPETRNRVLIGTGVVGVAAMLVWALTTPSGLGATPQGNATPTDEGVEPATPAAVKPGAAPSAAVAKPSAPAVAAAPAVDLFAGEMPEFMAAAHSDTLEKKWLDVSVQKELYAYGKAHRDDARPQLLLAWDSMNREWKGIAVRMYGIAYRADKRAKEDPTMLRDLVDVASQFDTVEYRESMAIIRDAYGAEALPHIDEQLAQLSAAGDSAGAERLRRLRVDITTKR